jgi:hypothetical protein
MTTNYMIRLEPAHEMCMLSNRIAIQWLNMAQTFTELTGQTVNLPYIHYISHIYSSENWYFPNWEEKYLDPDWNVSVFSSIFKNFHITDLPCEVAHKLPDPSES